MILSRKGIVRYGGGISHWAAKDRQLTLRKSSEPKVNLSVNPRAIILPENPSVSLAKSRLKVGESQLKIG